MKQPKKITYEFPSGTEVTITNKKNGNTVHIMVDSSLLKDDPLYNEKEQSHVTKALNQLFKNDINPTV